MSVRMFFLSQKRKKCAGSKDTGTGKVPQNDTRRSRTGREGGNVQGTVSGQKKSVHRKQTYISYDMYCRLARILPLLSDDMSVPAFLDNVLAHHLETYSEELGELFRRKTPKTF